MARLIIVAAFPSITFLRVFPGFIARPFRGVGVGFEEPHSIHGLVSGTGVSPNFPYFCICGSSGWASLLVLMYGLGRPVITSEIGNWSVFVVLGWRFIFGIIMK